MSSFPCPTCAKYDAADVEFYCEPCDENTDSECCQECGELFGMDDLHDSGRHGYTCSGCMAGIERRHQDTYLRYRSA